MKKYFIISSLIFSIFVFTGCQLPNNKQTNNNPDVPKTDESPNATNTPMGKINRLTRGSSTDVTTNAQIATGTETSTIKMLATATSSPGKVLIKSNTATTTKQAISYTNPIKPVDWKIYKSVRYGFMLTFPETWKGYIVTDRIITTGNSLDFGFSDQSSLFNIGVLTKAEWETLKSEAGNNLVYLGENKTRVFIWSPAQSTVNKNMDERLKEVNSIIKTFEAR